ncbi:MAG: hypothetical protein K2L64_03090, partial [Ureaplasma sp.]|nr:hypothetical protein [Ureaplasma sp.]
MYYINSIKNPNENRTDVFHNASLKIIPSITGNIMSIFFELYMYADINIPANSLLLEINSNFGKFENISLNINVSKSKNFNRYFDGKLLFDINESNELSKIVHQKMELKFIPNFKIDTNSFNDAKLTADNSSVHWFISKISLLDENVLDQQKYYYSNVYSLYDVLNNNFDKNEINLPEINVE